MSYRCIFSRHREREPYHQGGKGTKKANARTREGKLRDDPNIANEETRMRAAAEKNKSEDDRRATERTDVNADNAICTVSSESASPFVSAFHLKVFAARVCLALFSFHAQRKQTMLRARERAITNEPQMYFNCVT